MNRLTILVDLDGIVVDLMGPWIEHYNLTLAPEGKELTVGDVTDAHMLRVVPPEVGAKIYSVIEQPGWFLGLHLLAGARDTLAKWVEQGHRVVICSAPTRNPESAAEKFRWVKQHLPFIQEIIITRSKDLVSGDVLIDDSPAKQFAWLKAHPKGTVMQINWPYNDESLAQVKADSWENPDAAWQILDQAVAKLAG